MNVTGSWSYRQNCLYKEITLAENKFINKLKSQAKALKHNISALYLAYKRRDVPVLAKIIIIITIAYALSPIDLIPDFIPVLGYLDDLIILPFLIFLSLKLIPADIFAECKEQAKNLWKDEKPKKWYYAIPIMVIYGVILFVIIKKVLFGLWI